VHSCIGLRAEAPDDPVEADEFAADVLPGSVAPGPVPWTWSAAGAPALPPAPALPVDVDPEPLKATVPAVAAPPAATRPASDHATTFIEIRFTSGRFGIFLFLGVTA
jgi:pyruvate/2-oxoglutarate dehydrogenase complex dihydrolipoamide acyltransferase (E2) component